jgi:two-component system nitrogen regulation sensor histidine kinase NtrY
MALAVASAGAVALAVLSWRWRRTPAAFACALLLAAVAVAGWADVGRQSRLATPAGAEATRHAVADRATAVLADRLRAEGARLQEVAKAALRAPTDPERAFVELDRLRGREPARAVALARAGSLVAWAGRYLAPVDSLPGPVGAVGTEFHLVLYAVAGEGPARAVAMSLVHAVAPAASLADALDEPIASEFDVAGFDYARPKGAGADSGQVVTIDGAPVLVVRATPPGGPELRQHLAERARERGVVLLAVALACFLGATWRSGSTRERFGALVVVLGLVATVPLAALSNRTDWFSAAVYFVREGGPFTMSIGALMLVAATVLVGVLASQRARLFPTARSRAALVVVAVAALGPFLVSLISRGIRFPATGAPMSLWLGWETAVFLTGIVVLYAGISAGEALLSGRRGIPAWVAPLLAMVAAIVAPIVVEPRGGLPQWYTIAWVGAIVAMIVTRRSGASLWAAATVAAFGAATLVWSETVKARVLLAEQDVAGLGSADSSASAFVRRFESRLDVAAAPRSRVELLARYAASDLANSDLPVDITTWSPAGTPLANLRVGLGPGTTRGVEYFAREAAEAMQSTVTHVPGDLGMLTTVLAMPHEDRSVTTVVAAPRTRLVSPDPFPTITGLNRMRDAGGEPPYSLQLAPSPAGAFIATQAQWSRRNDELHGDWFLPTTTVGGVAHVHARVPLRGYGALYTRGGLLVCLNVGLLGALWLLLVVGDGEVLGRIRAAGAGWMRSFRLRLTVTLFAAFVLPAVGFAAWSYERLQDDDARARGLLVRETLRGVAAAQGSGLDSLSARFDTPLFLFADGVLVASSDPIFDALAPIGRILPPAAARALLGSDEGFATVPVTVAGEPIPFGFRVVSDTSAANLVLAAPARTADLELDPQRRDLALFVLFATILGALTALWLSGLAGRTFAEPIAELRKGALALAAGEREPRLAGDPPVEFVPVFSAFRQMAQDLEAGRASEARAQRVLAWGEMARQVAHEIKNPLTPMRLGVQHLLRAKDDPRVDFRRVLDENAARLLSEIDRLDEIARAFSRYGAGPEAQAAAVPVDVAEAVRDVVRLEQLGEGGVTWEAHGTDAPVHALARPTEFREVVLNLLENARLADAQRVTVSVARAGGRVRIAVRDDGHGIAPDLHARIFEPHFSTRTSGSGLGLAISRRLIDGWGGSIAVESAPGAGTTMTISLVAADAG